MSAEVSSVEKDGSVTFEAIETDQSTKFYGVDRQDDLINQIDSNYENGRKELLTQDLAFHAMLHLALLGGR